MKKGLLKIASLAMMLTFGLTANSQSCENVNGNMNSYTGTFTTNDNAWLNTNLANWNVSHGTPTLSSSVDVWLWSYSEYGEGVYTDFSFVSGETYELTYRLWRSTDANPTSTFRVELSNSLTPVTTTTSATPTPSGNQNLTTQPWASTGTWVTITETFVASATYSQLWFYPYLSGSPSPNQAAVRLDDVCVKKVITDPCAFEPKMTINTKEECTTKFTNITGVPTDFTILETSWDFGDGATATGSTVNHYYTDGGVYEVCMTVWMINNRGECCKKTVCERIEVRGCNPCESIERVKMTVSGTNPFVFTASNLPTGMYSLLGYHWDFGDGSTGTGYSTSHTYSSAGAYTVILTVYYYDEKEKRCCSVSYRREIEVEKGIKAEKRKTPITNDNSVVESAPSKINIYPNPSDGTFNLKMENGSVNTVTVYDQTGKKVLDVTNTSDNGVYVLNMTDLNKGMYIVIVNEADDMNRTFSKVIVE